MGAMVITVKPNRHCQALPLTGIELLGQRWSSQRVSLLEASSGTPKADVIGWTDYYGGGPCEVHVAYACTRDREGLLVWGDSLGVRLVPHRLLAEALHDEQHFLASHPILWLPDDHVLDGGVLAHVTARVMVHA
jgi:hypothetical protein